ncbi:MAG TPA: ABC transporter permease [Solirubrobacteraceae bacterium]|nr:ABC transporter permease [Solirubrobacteraceae bacterium]
MRRVLRPLPTLLLLLIFFGAWELYVDSGGVNNLILPAPHSVIATLYDDRGLLWSNFLVSAKEIVLGSLVAAALGFAMAISMHLLPRWRGAAYPLAIASQAIPVPILAVPLVFWLGFGLAPKLIVIAIVSFFSIVVTTMSGLATVDPALPKLMATFDATRWRTFRHVELPAALPGLFTGLKLTLVVAVIADVLAEQAGANSGLGYILLTAGPQLLTAEAFAAALILSLFAMLLFALLTAAERLTLPWAYQPRGDGRS